MYNGLTLNQVHKNLKRFGFNEIKQQKSRPPIILFFEQFKSPLVLILIFACLLSVFLGETIEAYAILAILFLNAFIGFAQEYRAENAIEALQKITAPQARVIRDGKKIMIPATHVVPEDLLLLEQGEIIAADGKIKSFSRLQVNEAILTGESFPVDKTDNVFMGTIVTAGTAAVEVTATGMQTELGKIAHMITTAQTTTTPLIIQLNRVSKILLFLCVAIVGAVAFIGYLQSRPLVELFVFSISLGVAAVPEGLPAIVTVALAIGVQRLAKQNALIRKLPSVETLGSVTTICTDKTGTLTTGLMQVRQLWTKDEYQLLLCCQLLRFRFR
ncbi:MAG: HAD-IC family P-type ATPase [Oligoflexia bacterium]|nr:HAD-IC family P-type ATPase [Oligoflexia bacterium]